MSMMPQHEPQPKLPLLPPELRSLLQEEWHHLATMPTLRFCLLVLPSIVLFFINPLLPTASYALQLWASHSWAWRDRWASVTIFAKQGGVIVALVLVLASLNSAHVWIVPQLTEAAQAWWHTHLPGDLSLSPLGLGALIARTLLLLPLAPGLALFYEHFDPRTRVQPQRVLTPADLAEPTTEAKASTTTSPTTKEAPQMRAKETLAPNAPATQRKRKSISSPPRQMTIEGFIALAPAQAAQPPPSPEVEKKVVPDINWDDVAE